MNKYKRLFVVEAANELGFYEFCDDDLMTIKGEEGVFNIRIKNIKSVKLYYELVEDNDE